RQDVAEKPRLLPLAVPGQAEAVGVDRRLRFRRAVALVDERMTRPAHDLLEEDRLARVGGPTAHGSGPRHRLEDRHCCLQAPPPQPCRKRIYFPLPCWPERSRAEPARVNPPRAGSGFLDLQQVTLRGAPGMRKGRLVL